MRDWIDRCVIQIRFTEAYMDWSRNLEGFDGEAPTDDKGNAYLIKMLDNHKPDYLKKRVSRHWRAIAEEEFEAWCTDEDAWPSLKTMKDFEKYFSWEITEIVIDLEENSPILKEF